MVDAAWMLIAERGLEGMSTREVLARTGAPRGSVYHHFPRGRLELVEEAIERARQWMRKQVAAIAPTDAADVVDGYLDIWRRVLTGTDFRAGCSAAGLVTGAQDADLLDRGAAAFADATDGLTELFTSVGLPLDEAARNATLLTCAAQGAVLMARAQRTTEALDVVGERLRGFAS